jgi:heme/copper-type cytochrome/quinol oxidase subunit 2
MDIMERAHPMLHAILQQITVWFQQVSAWFPAIPSTMLIFFMVVAGFIAFAIVVFVLRLLWAIILAVFGVNRRRRRRHADPEWERRVRLNALRQQHHWGRDEW